MNQAPIEAQMGTWGIVLKPNRKVNIVFDQPFHLKMAVLDFNSFIKQELHFRLVLLDNWSEKPHPLTICILSKQTTLQVPLDLHFEKGDDVTFFVKTDIYNMDVNSFSVHLSGATERDLQVFDRLRTAAPKNALSAKKKSELIVKSRSTSLPDEHFQNKQIPSPIKKSAPPELFPQNLNETISTQKPDAPPKSPLTKSQSQQYSPDEPQSPTVKEGKNKQVKKSESWGKNGMRTGGAVIDKLSKFLSKS